MSEYMSFVGQTTVLYTVLKKRDSMSNIQHFPSFPGRVEVTLLA